MAGVTDQFASLPNLQRAIVNFIMNQPLREEGVFIGVIAKAMGASGVDSHTIRYGHDFTLTLFRLLIWNLSDALEKLLNNGDVYTTIDDSHFNVSV